MYFYLHPEFNAPIDTTPADVADKGRTWQWNASESMHVFWAVAKLTHTELQERNKSGSAVARFNMVPREKEIAVVLPSNKPMVVQINVPVLVNVLPLKEGDEFMWEATARPKAKAKAKSETWRTDEAKRAKTSVAWSSVVKKAKKGFDGQGKIAL